MNDDDTPEVPEVYDPQVIAVVDQINAEVRESRRAAIENASESLLILATSYTMHADRDGGATVYCVHPNDDVEWGVKGTDLLTALTNAGIEVIRRRGEGWEPIPGGTPRPDQP